MNYTFTIIKPDALKANNIGNILAMICDADFTVKALKITHFTRESASVFYAVHKDKYFFDLLLDFIISGPIAVAVLEKENAVDEYRTLIGCTDSKEADKGTIRAAYGIDYRANAVHGSDSEEAAVSEAAFFFSRAELHNI